jgi:transposase
LQNHERESLERLVAGDDISLRQRALIVLLSSEERYRVPEIAPMVGLHMDKVRKWITRFNDQGMKGLQPAHRKPGPREKFDGKARKQIIDIAATSPRQLGQLRTRWTLDSLRDYLVDHNVVSEISRESLRQILLNADLNWQTTHTRSVRSSQWLSQWKASTYN